MRSTEPSLNELARFAGTWVLDPDETSVAFRTRALWVVPVSGTARALSGHAEVATSGEAKGALVIDASSFVTNNQKRDEHLRTADLFDVLRFPTMEFATDDVAAAGNGKVTIRGVLTVHGQTRPLTVHAEMGGTDDSVTVSTVFELDRSQWGVSWAKMGARLKTHLAIRAQFNRT